MHRQAYSRQQFCRAVLATANPMKCPGPAVSRRVPVADPPDLLRRPPPRPVRVHKPVARQLGQVIWSPDLDQVADGDFDGAIADQEAVNDAWAAWRAEVAFAEQFASNTDLSFVGRDSAGQPISLRELLVHMIEEYARHNGHADLLRERIDGRVGL
jgi:hypothetical protein